MAKVLAGRTLSFTDDPEIAGPGAVTFHERGAVVVGADGRVIGIVSIRDLNAFVRRQLEEELHQVESFIHDTGYGATA